MAKGIQALSESEFKLSARGCDMTLKKEGGQWAMYSINAVVKAYRRGHAIPKYFKSLADVEKKYKSWVGISNLVNDQ